MVPLSQGKMCFLEIRDGPSPVLGLYSTDCYRTKG